MLTCNLDDTKLEGGKRDRAMTPAERVAVELKSLTHSGCVVFADVERNPCSHVMIMVVVVVYMYPCLCDILMLHMSTLCVCVDRRRF